MTQVSEVGAKINGKCLQDNNNNNIQNLYSTWYTLQRDCSKMVNAITLQPSVVC